MMDHKESPEDKLRRELVCACEGLIEYVRGKYAVPEDVPLSCPFMQQIEKCVKALRDDVCQV